MASVSTTNKLPVWAKVLICCVVVSLTALFGAGLTGIFAIKRLGLDAVDPVKMKQTASLIGQFPDPLPKGWHYVVAVNLQPVGAMMLLEHDPDKQLLSFHSKSVGLSMTDTGLLDWGYHDGLNMLITTAHFTEVTKRGTLQIGTQKMPFIQGRTLEIGNRKGEGFEAACLAPSEHPKKNILIYALQTTNVPYNQQITMDLLDSIKGF